MARILTARRIMGSSSAFTERPDWGTAVVLDPRELSRLENANALLRASHRRRTLAAAVFFVGSVASTLTACWERLCLTSVSGTIAAAVGPCDQQVHESRKYAATSVVARAALAVRRHTLLTS